MCQKEENGKRIAVVGVGGVGGYLAGMLGKTYKHVTLGVRGQRMESIGKEGLVLHSDLNGEIVAVPEKAAPIREIGEQDYIFVCVKNYSLEEACAELKAAVTENTVIIPVMNGVNPGERIRKILNKGMVIDSLIYIIAFANSDYSITQQGDLAKIKLGIQNADEEQWKRIEEVSSLLSGAGIDHEITRDIETEIWKKYILNCAYNVATAFYDDTIGELRSSQEKAGEYEDLAWEAYQVARAKGIGITKEDIETIIHRFYFEYGDDATSSLQRDIRAGKRAEVDTFSGYLVKEAKRLGISAPVSERMYEGLKSKG